MAINIFDIIVGIILLLAIIKGYKKGFIREISSLAALILGVIGSIYFSSFTQNFLSQYINSDYIGIIAFFVTFLVIIICVFFIAKNIDNMINAINMGWLNRILGAFFSFLKISFIISILLIIISSINKSVKIIPDDVKNSSLLYKPIGDLAPKVLSFIDFEKIKNLKVK